MFRHNGTCEEQQRIVGPGCIRGYLHLAFKRAGICLRNYEGGDNACFSRADGTLGIIDEHFVGRGVNAFRDTAHLLYEQRPGTCVRELKFVFGVAIYTYRPEIMSAIIV